MGMETRIPKTLTEAVKYFADPKVALEYFVQIRWPKGIRCPHCGSDKVSFLANQNRWQCHVKHPRRQFVDHANQYADGIVHTNGLENFWALFKRCIKGTHVSIEPFHLAAYLDSEAFRFNNRKANDAGRFVTAMPGVVGKRLTYKTLIGAVELEGREASDSGAESVDNRSSN
jgi:ISXO2-like transposase domain/Transposase zinc-ribbon domain